MHHRNWNERCFRVFRSAIGAVVLLSCSAFAQTDLSPLSDEFGSAASMSNWQRGHEVEGWNNDPMEVFDINTTQPGRMVMMPYTVTWYENYRGPLYFKTITGDFVITADITATARNGVDVPGVDGQFALAGLMMRTPRNITPGTWTPGGENYVFLSIGYGSANPVTHQFEVKTTENSVSTLNLSPAPAASATLQLARLGEYVIALRREPGGVWQVHRRYHRDDFPGTLQVGLVSYTDWLKVSIFDPLVHNGNILRNPLPPGVVDPNPFVPFSPDIRAGFDYARYYRPTLPANLVGVDLTNETLAPDAALLAFLGENANVPAITSVPTMSDWGVLMLMLTLVAAGAIVLRKTSAPTT